MKKTNFKQRRVGQAMIIATLTIGGAILGATTLAGVLLLYQIRATTNVVESAQAIFAADTGVNWALYSYYHMPPAQGSLGNNPEPGVPAEGTLGDGAMVTVNCSDDTGAPIMCDTSATTTAISEGNANGARRAFLIDLSTATATVP